MKVFTALIIVAAGGALTGCATNWYNPNFAASDVKAMQKQKAIDEGYCTQVAQGSAPMPEARTYVPMQQSYSINGTVTSWGQGGPTTSTYSGYVTPSPAASFSSGFAQCAALGAAIRARRAQDAIMKGCMAKLGWSDKPPASEPRAPQSINHAASDDAPKPSPDDPEYVELSCSSHRKLAGSIDKLMRDGVPKQEALDLMLNTSKNNKIGYMSAARLLWATNTRYSAPEVSQEDFVDFITDYCAQGWPDVKL